MVTGLGPGGEKGAGLEGSSGPECDVWEARGATSRAPLAGSCGLEFELTRHSCRFLQPLEAGRGAGGGYSQGVGVKQSCVGLGPVKCRWKARLV